MATDAAETDNRTKQVIVVNQALRLPMGKLAAQVAHAAIGAFLTAGRDQQTAWLHAGMPKIVLAVQTETALRELETQAHAAGIAAFLVQDAGRTVVAAGTTTCLGIGPAPATAIDVLTGDLRLL